MYNFKRKSLIEVLRSSYLWWVSPSAANTQVLEFADALFPNDPEQYCEFVQDCIPAGMDNSYVDLRNETLSNDMKRDIISKRG